MPTSDRREQARHKARYGPTTTNPGLRKVARDLAAKAQDTMPCPVCAPVTYDKCAGCHGTGYVTSRDYYLILRTL